MNNKALTSKILGFIAMGMSIISIPMLFLPIINAALFKITIIDVLKISDLIGEYGQEIVVLPVLCIIAILTALAGAVLIPFSKKGLKTAGCVLNSIAFVVSLALLILIFCASSTANSEIGLGLSLVKPGIGLWLNMVLLLISMALSIAAAVMTPKAGTAEIYTPPIPTPPIGGDDGWQPEGGVPLAHGGITFLSGSCAGYQVPINGGDELIIGKDPAQCAIVIDKKYTKVSRKHCGVRFDPMQNIYIVTDYSTNGTSIVGGAKLANGSASYLESGTTINLAKTENSFRLD